MYYLNYTYCLYCIIAEIRNHHAQRDRKCWARIGLTLPILHLYLLWRLGLGDSCGRRE